MKLLETGLIRPLAALGLAALVGCASSQPPTYPSTPPPLTAAPPTTPARVRRPPRSSKSRPMQLSSATVITASRFSRAQSTGADYGRGFGW